MLRIYQALMAIGYALPSLLMARRLFHVWRAPLEVEEGRWINLGVGVFVMEFILLHAGVFLGTTLAGADGLRGHLLPFLGILAFYGIFALAISVAFKSRLFLHSFFWLIGGRFVAIVVGASQDDARLITIHSFVAILIYLPLVFLTMLPIFPRFGITAELARRFRMPGASGAWIDAPHRAIGAATVYFLLLGVVELTALSWVDPTRFPSP